MRKEKSPSTPAAKSTKLTSGTDKSCSTLSTDSIMKFDRTDNLCNPDNSVGSVSADNTDNAVNSVNNNTTSNSATLFTDEQTTPLQPKQPRIGSKQRRLEFSDYKANYLAPVKIENRHSLNISNTTWERLERVARILGDRGANVGSYAERILSEHLDAYADDIEAWRKL